MSSGKILPFTDPIDHRLPGHMPDCEDRGAPNEDDVVAWEEEEDARAQEIIEAERVRRAPKAETRPRAHARPTTSPCLNSPAHAKTHPTALAHRLRGLFRGSCIGGSVCLSELCDRGRRRAHGEP